MKDFLMSIVFGFINGLIHTFFNAIGAWIILDELGKTHLGLWSYVFIGIGLTVILNGNTTSKS